MQLLLRAIQSGLLCACLFSAQLQASQNLSLQFSLLEQRLDKLMASHGNDESLLTALQELYEDSVEQAPGYLSLILQEQCTQAYLHQLPSAKEYQRRLDVLNLPGEEVELQLARKVCQYAARWASGQHNQLLELAFRAYNLQQLSRFSRVRYQVSINYASTALAAGFMDEAVVAVKQALAIAQFNKDTQRESESLNLLGLIQADLALFDDALTNNDRAFQLSEDVDTMAILPLLQNRGYILNKARRYDEAVQVYQQLLELSVQQKRPQNKLIAAIHLSHILHKTGRYQENLELTATVLQEAIEVGTDYLIARSQMARAFALLATGHYVRAKAEFNHAQQWFEQAEERVHLAEGLKDWAGTLAEQGFEQDAYQALLYSVELQQQVQQLQREHNALFFNAVLDSEQKTREIEALQQENQLFVLEQERVRLTRLLWMLAALAVLVLTVVLLAGYIRLNLVNGYLKSKNEALDYESTHDPLTRVFNRRYFNRFIQQKVSSSEQAPALLMLADIDFFKKVNDKYGHQVGDLVLQQISQRLASGLRDTDRIVRWGGEEFLIFIDKPLKEEQTEMLIKRLLQSIAQQPLQVADVSLEVTISMGFAVTDVKVISQIEKALSQVDEFLYQAKEQGRSRAIGQLSAAADTVTIEPV